MRVINSAIAGVYMVQPEVHDDERGEFAEFYRATQPPLTILQANVSESAERTVRGIHYSREEHGQYKYVTCTSGAVLDWVVDLRPRSKTFGQWRHYQLDSSKRNALQIPPGVGHCVCSIDEWSTLVYMQTTTYDPEAEKVIWPLDRDLNLTFPYNRGTLILSKRDSSAETFAHSDVWREHHGRS